MWSLLCFKVKRNKKQSLRLENVFLCQSNSKYYYSSRKNTMALILKIKMANSIKLLAFKKLFYIYNLSYKKWLHLGLSRKICSKCHVINHIIINLIIINLIIEQTLTFLICSFIYDNKNSRNNNNNNNNVFVIGQLFFLFFYQCILRHKT